MKTLLLMRHAKSSWKNRELHDHDRPLKKRGLKNAPEMGRRLADRGITPDTIVTSSAVRAEATARLVMKAAGWSAPLLIRKALYLARQGEWLSVLRELSGGVVIAFGHDPGISEFANCLTHEGISLPTATVAIIELPIASWSDLRIDTAGTLVDLWSPKDKDST